MELGFRKQIKEPTDTSETFTHTREPLQQRKVQNLPFVTQIQDLMAVLIRKKNEVKQLKLIEANLKAKGQDQECRIDRIQIQMDHQIVKQEAGRNRISKIQRQSFWHKETTRQLSKQTQLCKNQAVQTLNSITKIQRMTCEIKDRSSNTLANIQEKQQQKRDLEQQLYNLDTLICRTQNSIRQKQDVLTNSKIQQTQINSTLAYIQQRSMLTMKSRNKVKQDNQILDRNLQAGENKMANLRRQMSEGQWCCQQIMVQNEEVDDLNSKLSLDLESVHKHLFNMQKMNKILRQSLEDYSVTGEKVSRMINLARSD